MTTYVHKFKHLVCQLHFSVYSYSKDWAAMRKVTCPECGTTIGGFIYWQDESEQEIFELVPGESPMESIVE